MLKLRNIRPSNIHQRRIRIHNPMRYKRPHPEMIILRPRPLQRAPRKDNSPEILINSLEQRPRRRVVQPRSANVFIPSVPVYPDVLPRRAAAGTPERLDGEDIAFFHALGRACFDEGHLLIPVDVVAEDVVAGDAADGFDGERFAVELDFVALHYFLHYGAHVVHAGVDAGFLGDY